MCTFICESVHIPKALEAPLEGHSCRIAGVEVRGSQVVQNEGRMCPGLSRELPTQPSSVDKGLSLPEICPS